MQIYLLIIRLMEKRGKDLFPKDFIYALDAPSNYFGAKKIFLDTDFKHIVTIPEPKSLLPIKHKKDLYLMNYQIH